MKYDLTVMGLGYIGLPMAALSASCGMNVLGVDIREDIVNIIATHQVPFFAFADKPKVGSNKPLRTPEYIAHQLSWQLPLNLLINVATADMLGRTFKDKQNCLDDIELFKEVAKEQNCYLQPRQFPDSTTRL